MKQFLKNILIRTTFKQDDVDSINTGNYSDFKIAKAYRRFQINTKQYVKDFILIAAGIISASFGFKGFLLTNKFIDGGATGISLLISALSDIPLYILIICINIPFVLLGYKILGKEFAFKTILAISGLALCVATVEFPNVTNDNLLVAIFGGFFLGAGIGLAVRGGAVIDGTEVLAIYLSKKFGTTIGDIIILINILIFGAAAYFLSIETAMYSMITYLAASKTLDYIIEGIEEYIGVTIVATRSEEIKKMIIETMGRGVTVYNGKKGFEKNSEVRDTDILFTVLTRLELNRFKTELEKIEPEAFVVMNSVKETKGGMIKKRPLAH